MDFESAMQTFAEAWVAAAASAKTNEGNAASALSSNLSGSSSSRNNNNVNDAKCDMADATENCVAEGFDVNPTSFLHPIC